MAQRKRQRAKRAGSGAGSQGAGSGAGAQPTASPTREKLVPAPSEYRDAEGNVLALRGSFTPGARAEYARVLGGGLQREDAWQRATELLFERLAVSWTISDALIERQNELLGRYRMASVDERRFVREALRAHLQEHFPEVQAP